MPDINITVAHKVAVSDTQSIVCDNSDYTVHWTLDEEWHAYDTKTMRTIYMDGTFKDKVFAGDEIALPVCTVPGVVQIGLFAGDIRTSRVAILRALPSVRSAAGAPEDPPKNVYDQIMELINGLGGVDPDVIAKAVADYLAAHPVEETDPTVSEWAKAEITGANVGQIAKITAVDESGKPTAWAPVDMPSGGENTTWVDTLLAKGTLQSGVSVIYDTGVSLSQLRGYKSFAYILKGASNTGLANLYLQFERDVAHPCSLDRGEDGGRIAVFEWADTAKTVLYPKSGYSGNPSMVTLGGLARADIYKTLYGAGQYNVIKYVDVSDVADSDTLRFYCATSPSIDYAFEIRGLVAWNT